MTKRFLVVFALFAVLLSGRAGNIDDIRKALEQSSVSQLQEKVYIHTDNQCYFVGDTLWYKAYVVQAGNLQPTSISRLLYVELLSPDGLLVERQTIVVNPTGYTCGQFCLQDSLYSGYYELRAYTRWMLNFNVRHHRYSTTDKWAFFDKQMAADYYRIWDGLYSRVLPVYSKPEEAGNYDSRRMYQRPKTRIQKPKKEKLLVSFYPEGGTLLQGVINHVAFEATDQNGEAVDVKGVLRVDGASPVELKTEYMGRGSFTVVPVGSTLKAEFSYKGRIYDFMLPKAQTEGVALHFSDGNVTIAAKGLSLQKEYGISVLCRGVLRHFEKIRVDNNATVQLPMADLPTGVNEVTVFDDDGRILANRLFFVNHQDQDGNIIEASFSPTQILSPYQKVEIPVQCRNVSGPVTFSLSFYDTNTAEPTYDDGNIMTSMLLSSDLRGFIARPAYYFEKDDAVRRHHLDLLMQVQGWRKYKWQELADSARVMRYSPERGLTVEGHVYKMISINEIESEEIEQWLVGGVMVGTKERTDPNATDDPFADTADTGNGLISTEDVSTDVDLSSLSTVEYGSVSDATSGLRIYGSSLRREVLVEAEIGIGQQFVGSVQKTQGGHFVFSVPPFYGAGYLNMKAYNENDSVKKNMSSRRDQSVYDEDAYSDYYVKRDLFYPKFTHEYSFYENHQPDIDDEQFLDTLSDLSMENDVQQLGNVTVKGRRRGRRAIDWKKPAFVMDAYDMYNELTDYGLSYGKLDMRLFPVQVCRYLYGNMNRYRMFNVDGRLEGSTYFRNYNPFAIGSEVERAGLHRANRTPQWYMERLKLKRLQDIRVFTDYEPRNEDSTMVESQTSADATVELVLIPDDGKQVTYRDRHILFHGFNAPEEFYQPDYSERRPDAPADYRRTLYWNPNAVTDEEGRFTAVFYNNGKETRIKMTAAGVTPEGQLLFSKPTHK